MQLGHENKSEDCATEDVARCDGLELSMGPPRLRKISANVMKNIIRCF